MNDKKKFFGFSFAWNGLKEVLKNERNFQVHIVAAVIVIILGIILKLFIFEWIFILLAISLVLITEMINSAIEKTIDYFKPEYHPLAKSIKDISASVVLIAAITAVLIGLLIFTPKIYILISP